MKALFSSLENWRKVKNSYELWKPYFLFSSLKNKKKLFLRLVIIKALLYTIFILENWSKVKVSSLWLESYYFHLKRIEEKKLSSLLGDCKSLVVSCFHLWRFEEKIQSPRLCIVKTLLIIIIFKVLKKS